jgi:hypothetical protein
MLVSLLGGAGCATSRAFRPAEHVTALSPRGDHYAAEYTVRDASHLIAEVKVWSRGASRDGSDGEAATIVHVGFEVGNLGEAPVRLEPKQLYLDDVVFDDGERDRIRAFRINGDTLVPPGSEREIEVLFSLPEDVWPNDVLGYRVAWQLSNGGSYSQKTPFLRAVNRRDADPLYPYVPFYGYHSVYWPYPYGVWPSWRYGRYYPGWPHRPLR